MPMRATIQEKEFNRLVGARIREARELRGIGAREMARRLGVALQMIYFYEGGRTGVSSYRLDLIAQILDVNVRNLIPRVNTIKNLQNSDCAAVENC